MITERVWKEGVEIQTSNRGEIARQCLPLGVGNGTIYATPLYFEANRRPVAMMPRVDARQKQDITLRDDQTTLATLPRSGETFYVWNFAAAES